KLGRRGDIVDVSSGYAKNALFPRQLAKYADDQTIAKWKSDREKEKKEQAIRKEAAGALAEKFKNHIFQFSITVGKNGEIFNSLQEEKIRDQVANFCRRENSIFTPEDVHIKTRPIKQLGKIRIPARLGRGEGIVNTEI